MNQDKRKFSAFLLNVKCLLKLKATPTCIFLNKFLYTVSEGKE